MGVPCIEEVQDDAVVELRNPVTVLYVGIERPSGAGSERNLSLMLHMSTTAVGLRDLASVYRLGIKDLVHEVESQVVEDVDRSLPVLTQGFVESSIEFTAAVPHDVRAAVCQHVIDYSHTFS